MDWFWLTLFRSLCFLPLSLLEPALSVFSLLDRDLLLLLSRWGCCFSSFPPRLHCWNGAFCRRAITSWNSFLLAMSKAVSPCWKVNGSSLNLTANAPNNERTLFRSVVKQSAPRRIRVSFLRDMAAAMCNAVSPFYGSETGRFTHIQNKNGGLQRPIGLPDSVLKLCSWHWWGSAWPQRDHIEHLYEEACLHTVKIILK